MIALSWMPIYLVYASNPTPTTKLRFITGLAMALEPISSDLNANDALPFVSPAQEQKHEDSAVAKLTGAIFIAPR